VADHPLRHFDQWRRAVLDDRMRMSEATSYEAWLKNTARASGLGRSEQVSWCVLVATSLPCA